MPAVKPKINLVARLDLNPIDLFRDGHRTIKITKRKLKAIKNTKIELPMVETGKPGIRKIFACEGILLLPTWRCFRITRHYTERRHDILNHFDCIMTHCRLHFKPGFSPGIHVEMIGVINRDASDKTNSRASH
jgi:hypothetical protein